jgi:hypothetical protein
LFVGWHMQGALRGGENTMAFQAIGWKLLRVLGIWAVTGFWRRVSNGMRTDRRIAEQADYGPQGWC